MKSEVRLHKFLAQCGIASRRKAESYIAQGRIMIDGHIVTDMGTKIVPNKHIILFDGKPVQLEEKKIYILLNKPKGYVTTLSDPQGRPIVTSLVTDIQARLFPVGRLDLDTEGALILTNDGNFAQKIQHPRFEITKTYEALVQGQPRGSLLNNLEKGILLEGKLTAPARLRMLNRSNRSSLIQITIHEGRKRQVKKMFQAIGHPVINLKRIAYGSLGLKNLPKGSYRTLTPEDLNKIFKEFPLQKEK